MQIEIDVETIYTAISNVNKKLAQGIQKEKVYASNKNNNQYYLNNVIGEIGELVFAKAVNSMGYVLEIDAHQFGSFMNSDVCDFYGSKSGKTFDVKTVYGENRDNLIISKKIADWRSVYSYILVKLNKNKIESMEDIYEIKSAEVLGSMTDSNVKKSKNIREMYGREVYFINKERLTPIHKLIQQHYFNELEFIQVYNPRDSIVLDIASLENGSIINNNEINILSFKYKDKNDGRYNFMCMKVNERRMVSFSIYNGKFHECLFVKSLLQSAAVARKQNKLLIIPDYIQAFVSKEKYDSVLGIINNLKCQVRCTWKEGITV